MCDLTAEIGAQVMLDVYKGVPVSTTIEDVNAGGMYRALPIELTGDAEFNKILDQSVTEMHSQLSANADYREQVNEMSPEELKFGLFLASIAKQAGRAQSGFHLYFASFFTRSACRTSCLGIPAFGG